MEFNILNLFLVLLVAWLGGQLAVRFGYPSVLGELLAGILLGPPLFGILYGSPALQVLAELGVLLMMLYIGMEIDPKDLGKASKSGILAALGGFIVPFGLGYWIVTAADGTQIAGVFVGMAMGVTSLATKSRILIDLKIIDTRIAHVMMAGALIADTLSLIIFAGIISFSEVGSLDFIALLIITFKVLLFFVFSWFLGLKVFPKIYKWLKDKGFTGRTFNATLILLTALAFAELAHLAELHGILGAFIAGLVLREAISEKKLSHELTELVKDVSLGFLAPIFFVTAGFQVSFEVFQTDLYLLINAIVLATLGKIIGTALFYLPSGNGWREGITIGAGMNGRGAVEIVIAGIGLKAGIITQEIFSILVFMAIATTATVPILLKVGVDWLKKRNELVKSSIGKDDIIIIGAGPLARLFGKSLISKRPIIMIDTNEANCIEARKMGLNAVHGDALDNIVIRDAGISTTGMLITMTENAEINVLTAIRCHKDFFVPKIYAAIINNKDKGLINQLNENGGSQLFDRILNISEWNHKIITEKMVYEQIKVNTIILNEIIKLFPENSLPMIIVRDEKKIVFDGFENIIKGDIVLTLLPK